WSFNLQIYYLNSRFTQIQEIQETEKSEDQTAKLKSFDHLIRFWSDTAHLIVPFLYFQGEKAKLENSEKNLNFAAQSYLTELKSVSDLGIKTWMAGSAKELFEKVLKINPANDSASIGWGSTFIYGASGSASPMEGIMKIREVAQRDSTNMYAQFMLGYGGMMTGQYDKAIVRLLKVVAAEPKNMEAIFLLAEAYERSGNKIEALNWYEAGRKKVNNPELLKVLDEKMNSLK
ncbi:MAG: tetratricopeptide repeat protein, partial [Chitinophagaceae bacterium]